MAVPLLIAPSLRLQGLVEAVSKVIKGSSRQGVGRKAEFLSGLLLGSYLRQRRHDQPESFGRLEASYFRASDLEAALGGKHRDPKTGQPAYAKFMAPFWSFEAGNAGYSKAKGLTKRYVLKPEAIALVEAELQGGSPAQIINRETGKPLAPSDLPPNGVYRTSYSTLTMPPMVGLDLEALDQKIEACRGSMAELSHIARHHLALSYRHLLVARKWVEAFGGVPNLYSDFAGENPAEGHGRLYGSGSFHLQSMPGRVRRVLLGGMGLWDYDFRSCNVSLICSLAAAAGEDTGAVGEYRERKAVLHAELADACDVSEDAIKEAFLSLIYGATASPHEGTAIGKNLGYTAASRFLDAPFVHQFQTDILRLAIAILEWSNTGNRPERWTEDGVYNVVGKYQPSVERVEEDGEVAEKEVKPLRILSHLLQGYEAWCLNVALTGRPDVICLIFDGWVGGKADPDAIAALIRVRSTQDFGFPLDMAVKETLLD